MWNTVREQRVEERVVLKTTLWRRIFIDEADTIDFTNGHDELHALFYWFITATYLNLIFSAGAIFNVQSSLPPLPTTSPALIQRVQQSLTGQYLSVVGCRHRNLVSNVAGISSHQVSSHIPSSASHVCRLLVRNSEAYVSASFVTPPIHHSVIPCATPRNIHLLEAFISADMMERLHAGDVGGALECVGMTSQSEEELVGAVTASFYKELENARRTFEYKKTIDYSSDAAKAKALETCELKIASLESRIQAIEDRVKKAAAQTCPICLSDVVTPAVTPCCAQIFCFECLCRSLKSKAFCAFCRERIDDIKTVKVLGAKAEEGAEAVEGKGGDAGKPGNAGKFAEKLGKRETAVAYLKDRPEARTLIFSSYDASFSGLGDALERAGIKCQTVNGSQARITKVLREFAEGKHTVLFLNARNMGTGLNITSATHVMMFHKMSKELETQIIGRAVRLGRAAPLEVIHLLHDNELRENVVTYH